MRSMTCHPRRSLHFLSAVTITMATAANDDELQEKMTPTVICDLLQKSLLYKQEQEHRVLYEHQTSRLQIHKGI